MRLARVLLLAGLFATVSVAGDTPAVPEAAPGAPQLNAPPDGASLPDFRANLAWTNPQETTQYHLEVVPFNNDGPGINLVRNVENSFIVQPPQMGTGNYVLLPDMTYTWRVSASDNPGFAPPGDASYGPAAQRTFKTPAVTGTGIGTVSPSDGGNVDILTPALQWQDADNRVFYYEVQISKDPGFGPSSFLYWELVHGGVSNQLNSYRVPDGFSLESNARYYWRVRPRVQGDGTPVAWSRTFNFETPAGELRVRLERAFLSLTIPKLTNMVQPNDGTTASSPRSSEASSGCSTGASAARDPLGSSSISATGCLPRTPKRDCSGSPSTRTTATTATSISTIRLATRAGMWSPASRCGATMPIAAIRRARRSCWN